MAAHPSQIWQRTPPYPWQAIELALDDEETRTLLRSISRAVRHVARTNVYLDERSALVCAP
eukprot:4279854-Prymnesium_polylepis.2